MDTQNTNYMDGYLQREVGTIQRMLKRKWDCVGIVDGREGGGKTTFAFQLCKAIDPTFNINRVCFNQEQFNDQITNCVPGSGKAICLDEAMNVFFSRTAMSKANIEMVRVLAECRKRNLFLILVMPSFFEVDRYPALHRASFLAHIYTMPTPERNLQRGYFRWYDRKAKKKLYLEGKKKMIYQVAKPTFFGRFTKEFPINEKEYEAKKDKALKDKTETKTEKKKTLKEAVNDLCKTGLTKAPILGKVLRSAGWRFPEKMLYDALKEVKKEQKIK